MVLMHGDILGQKTYTAKISNGQKYFLNYPKFSYIVFCPKMPQSPKTYTISTDYKHFYHFFWLLQLPNFISKTNPTNLLDAMLHAWMLFLTCFAFFKFVTSSQKPDMNNSFRIISMKIRIVKATFITICTKNIHLSSKKCDLTKNFIKKEKSKSSLANETSESFLITLPVTNESETNVNPERQLYHKFFES